MGRTKNRLLAKLLTKHPALLDRMVEKMDVTLEGVELTGIPFTKLTRPISECKVALVTTAGVHLKTDTPFGTASPDGDFTFR
ncbi:MAG: selenoprotein B, partial [Thermodesulfobacteriota bacterium]